MAHTTIRKTHRSTYLLTAALLALLMAFPATAFAEKDSAHSTVLTASSAAKGPTSNTGSSGKDTLADGFHTIDGKVYYYRDNTPLTGFQLIDDQKYYFDPSGVMQTGAQTIEGFEYYFDSEGVMQTGLVAIGTDEYYYNNKGRKVYGSKKIDGVYYFFNQKSGKMHKNRFAKIGENKYYYDNEGKRVYGSQEIDGTHYFFHRKNGKMRRGCFVKDGKNKYYYAKNGKRVYGSKKIDGAYYFFHRKNGKMRRGCFVKDGKNKYYYAKNGKRVYGSKKIDGTYYFFNQKNGKMRKDRFIKRTYHDRIITAYYAKNGKMRTGEFKVGTVSYQAKSSGEIFSVLNNVKTICQRPQLPTGCEITAWTMMAQYAGVSMSKTRAARVMPRSSNPNRGFVGSPYSSSGGALVVYPNGLTGMTKKYLGSAEVMTRCSTEQIQNKLWNRHLVMVWVSYLDGFASHTVTLTGYDSSQLFYNDPWTGTKRSMSYGSFYSKWRANGRRALSY